MGDGSIHHFMGIGHIEEVILGIERGVRVDEFRSCRGAIGEDNMLWGQRSDKRFLVSGALHGENIHL